jgi:hypothetical protein
MTELRPEISDWAEEVAHALAEATVAAERQRIPSVGAMLYAATADEQIAYEVLVTLSRTVALVLRPTGHAGGPIGTPVAGVPISSPAADPAWRRGAQLIGFAAQGDHDMVDALARSALAGAYPLDEARATLWSILEVLASEPVLRPDPQEGPTA